MSSEWEGAHLQDLLDGPLDDARTGGQLPALLILLGFWTLPQVRPLCAESLARASSPVRQDGSITVALCCEGADNTLKVPVVLFLCCIWWHTVHEVLCFLLLHPASRKRACDWCESSAKQPGFVTSNTDIYEACARKYNNIVVTYYGSMRSWVVILVI